MISMFVALVTLASIALSNADPNWNSLTVTWGLNPFSQYEFLSCPREVSDAASGGWLLRDNYCGSDTKFRGIRYWDSTKDGAVTLLFDVAGYIAGIQTSIPKTKYTPFPEETGHPFVDDGFYWTHTAYFVDPSIICTTGRTAAQFALQGTGDRLVIMNGTWPDNAMANIPMSETLAEGSIWTKGKCFWTMGMHYWYNVSLDMSCKTFFPLFNLYNNGALNGFGFAINANLPSPHYDNPRSTPQDVSQFINPVPNCVFVEPSFNPTTTLHVFFTDNPRTGNYC